MSIHGFGLSFEDEEGGLDKDVFSKIGSWNGHLVQQEDGEQIQSASTIFQQQHGTTKSQILPLKGTVGGSVEAKGDTDGDSSIDGEVHVSVEDDDGAKVTVSAEGRVSSDDEGNVSAQGGVKISFEKDF